MQCKNHPDVAAVNRCAACAEAFCPNCLVEIQGQPYCASCKVLGVQGQPAAFVQPSIPCKEANEALTYSLIGIICLGIILEPIAIIKALRAKRLIAENPQLSGAGKANAALIIGIVSLILWAVGVIARLSQLSHT